MSDENPQADAPTTQPETPDQTTETSSNDGVGQTSETEQQSAPSQEQNDPSAQSDRPGDLSFGEQAVGLTFNPSGDDYVGYLKRQFAKIIDDLHNFRSDANDGDVARMVSVAITELQTAQMWAVKAVTWKKPAPDSNQTPIQTREEGQSVQDFQDKASEASA